MSISAIGYISPIEMEQKQLNPVNFSGEDQTALGQKAERFALSNSCPLSTRVQREQMGMGRRSIIDYH